MNDNAGNGLRGLRAMPSQQLLDSVSKAYGIVCGNTCVDLGGSANLNLLVGDGGNRYVVRVYRPFVTAERLSAIHFVRRELAAAGVPCHGLVPTQDQQPWMLFERRLVEVERYVEHDAVMDSWERFALGLPVLGRIHSVLRTLAVGDAGKTALFANHIEAGDVIERTALGAQRIRAWNPSLVERQLADDAEALAAEVAEAEQTFAGQLPRQLVHGDFWDNNVFFRNGSVVFVADFDFMGVRPRIDDLALTFYFVCLHNRSASVTDELLGRLRRLLDAYNANLDLPLSASERTALPVAMARQPLWSIGGWVATLDDQQAARRHAFGTVATVAWARHLMNELDRWQAAFV